MIKKFISLLNLESGIHHGKYLRIKFPPGEFLLGKLSPVNSTLVNSTQCLKWSAPNMFLISKSVSFIICMFLFLDYR